MKPVRTEDIQRSARARKGAILVGSLLLVFVAITMLSIDSLDADVRNTPSQGNIHDAGGEKITQALAFLDSPSSKVAQKDLVVSFEPEQIDPKTSQTIVRLIKQLSAKERAKRVEAADILVLIGNPAVGHLEFALASEDPRVRYWAVDVLWRMKSKQAQLALHHSAVKKLSGDLYHQRDWVRYNSLISLEKIGTEEAIRLIKEAANSKHGALVKQAKEILTRIGSTSTISRSPLEGTSSLSRKQVQVFHEAIAEFEQGVSYLDSGDIDAAVSAMNKSVKINPRLGIRHFDLISEDEQKAKLFRAIVRKGAVDLVVLALNGISEHASSSQLLTLLDHQSRDVRIAAMKSLKGRNNFGVLRGLRSAYDKEKDAEVRELYLRYHWAIQKL